jgi:hypothetical protein
MRQNILQVHPVLQLMHHANKIGISGVGQLLEIAYIVFQPGLVMACLWNGKSGFPPSHDVAEDKYAAQLELWRRADDGCPCRRQG